MQKLLLEGLNNGLKEEQTILKQWYESKTKIENEMKNLKSKINNIQNNLTEMEKIKEQLKECYLDLIKIKIEQKKKYEDLKSVLEQDVNITFEVKIEFNYEELFAVEDSIIKHGQGNSQEKIQDILKDKFISVLNINENNIDDDFSHINDLINWINGDLFIRAIFGENRSSESLLKKGLNLSDFYDWCLG